MARLRVQDGGVAFDVYLDDKLCLVVGRNDTCHVTLNDAACSREHCEIRQSESEGFVLSDLGSSNGTKLNGRVVKRQALRSEDRVMIGEAVLQFFDPDQEARLAAIAARGGKKASARVPAIAVAPVAASDPVPAAPRRISSRRMGVRRRGADPMLMVGGLAVVALVLAIVVVTGARGGASVEGERVLDRARALARGQEYREALDALKDLPAALPSDVRDKADALREEWRRRLKSIEASAGPATPVAGTPAAAGAATASGARARAFEALTAATARATALQGEGRFGAAAKAFSEFCAAHDEPEAQAEARTRQTGILDAAAAEWERRDREAQVLVKQRRFAEARALYQRVVDEYGLPDFEKLGKKKVAFVDDVSAQ